MSDELESSKKAKTAIITSEEIDLMVSLLKKLKPGTLPLSVFLETTRLTVTPIIEVVPLRINSDGNIQILLTKRDEDDSNWPGMFHTPGTVIRATDTEGTYDDAFTRILIGELKGTKTGDPTPVGNILHKVKRGMESSLIHWVEVYGDPKVGEFYDLDQLPDNLIDTQIGFIKQAAAHYQAQRNQGKS